MGDYLAASGGHLQNENKTEFEKDIASRMISTNNSAEGVKDKKERDLKRVLLRLDR